MSRTPTDVAIEIRGLTTTFPGETGRVPVVDEVDLHLHPSWQRTVAAQLMELLPETQFILTTHSPSVVQGAIDRNQGVVSLSRPIVDDAYDGSPDSMTCHSITVL